MKVGFLVFNAVSAISQPFNGSTYVEKWNDNLTATLYFLTRTITLPCPHNNSLAFVFAV